MTPELRVVPAPREEEGDGEVLCDYASRPVMVPDGRYQAVMVRHETAFVFKSAKVFLWFRIVEPGEHFGVELYRAYRVKHLVGKPGRNGKFKLAPGSDLFAMLVKVLEVRKRPDRISLRSLRQCVLEVKTRVVKSDYRQRDQPEWLHYSVVEDVTRKLTEISI